MVVLKNACILQFQPPSVKKGMDILIDKGIIADVGKNIAVGNPQTRSLDLGGSLVSPGLVCSHNHFYSVLARGIVADIEQSTDFVSILRNLWWRLDRAIDEEILYFSGLIGAMEAIKAGTTAVIDHHASPSFIKGSLKVLKQAFEKTGLRGMLCYEVTDRNGKKGMLDGVEENITFARSIDEDRKSVASADRNRETGEQDNLLDVLIHFDTKIHFHHSK